ncbi:MAG TPA: IPT/TIG domain-containing protein, partial [Pontibacter sp.]
MKSLLKQTVKWRALYLIMLISTLTYFGVSAFNNYQPSISSDKDDYAPGEIAIISGYGWTQDSIVHVEFKEEPDYPDYHVYDVAVNKDGSWTIKYQVEDRHLGVKFLVTALGKQTGTKATTVFTDAPTLTSISPTTGSTAGGTLVTLTGSGYVSSASSITVKFGDVSVAGTRVNNTTVTAVAPAHTAGTVDVAITVVAPGGGNSGTATLKNAYTYTVPCTTPSTPVVTVVDNCNGTSTLSTTASGSLLWSTGETTSSITVATAGTYTVTTTV